MRYKVGDRVEIIDNYCEMSGIIIDTSCVLDNNNKVRYSLRIDWDSGDSGWYKESSLKLINKKNIMEKLGIWVRKLVDKDTRILLKAGYLNGDLEPTDKGKLALDFLTFQAHKKELVELAQEEIKENAKKKKESTN